MIRSLPFPDLTNLRLPSVAVDEVKPRVERLLHELPRVELPRVDLAGVAHVAQDAAYIAVGFGVLGVQRLQVRRREIARALTERRATPVT